MGVEIFELLIQDPSSGFRSMAFKGPRDSAVLR
jgi:hypothetical protein